MKKLLKNGTYNILTLVVPGILLILATPLLVRWLGLERYGIWVICSTLLGLFGLLDFGLKETAITFIPKYVLSHDDGSLARHVNGLLCVNLAIGIFSTGFLYLTSTYVATRLFSISAQYQAESISTFRILAIGLLPGLTINLLSAVAMGFQRFDLSTGLLVARNIITMIGTIVVAAYSRSLLAIVGFSVIVSWLIMIVGFFVLLPLFPAKRLLLSLPTWKDFKEVALFGGYSFLANVSLLSMGVFDKLIIGVLMNPAAVALYSIPMSLVSKVEQVLVKFAQALFPYFSEIADSSSENKSSTQKTLHVFDISIDASFFVALGAGSLVFILAEPILRLWMGADFAMQATWILRGLMAGYAIKILNVLPTYILYSQKKPAINAVAYSVSGVVYIMLIVLLVNKVSLGSLSFCSLAYLMSCIILLKSISNSLQKPISWYLYPHFAGAVVGILCAYAIIYVGFLRDIWTIIACGLVFSVAYFLVSVFVASLGSMKADRSMRIYHQLSIILYPRAKT